MKKVVSIFAVLVMSVGLFTSCESETNVEDNDALYDVEVQASDRAYNETTRRT
ncbi:hypothetical protein [Pricia sp.]|uniref:hypothetical protein n=1 Tax=Pricia sp. TaxID=2268138 RepID=UPI00359309B8